MECPVCIVTQGEIKTIEQMNNYYKYIISNKGEGIMLKDPDSVYEQKRSDYMLKYKPTYDAEAIIILANAMEKDPEFYNFQRTLQAYRIFIDSQTTIVLPAESELFQFLEDPSEINEK